MLLKAAIKNRTPLKAVIFAYMIIGVLITSGCGYQTDAAVLPVSAQEPEDDTILFYVTKDGLYAHDLINDQIKQLHASSNISSKMYPLLVSPDGKHIAYTAEDELYVTSTDFGEVWAQPVCVLSGLQAKNSYIGTTAGVDINYAWADNNRLLYAKDDMIGLYDLKEVKATDKSCDFHYENLIYGKDGVLYAKRSGIKDQGTEHSGKELTEIVKLNIDDLFAENENWEEEHVEVLLSGSPFRPDEGGLEKTYTIAGISPDKTKLFIWAHTYSASISADGTEEVIFYDLLAAEKAKAQDKAEPGVPINAAISLKVEDGILMYPDNIAASPADSGRIALNAGYGREMWTNKQVRIFDAKDNSFTPVDFGCKVTMTPAYSPDGKLLVCSGGKDQQEFYMRAIRDMMEPESSRFQLPMDQIMARSIYVFDTETEEAKRLTFVKDVCDFAPEFISNRADLVFARWDEKQKNLSIIRLWNTEISADGSEVILETSETVIAESVKYPVEEGTLFGFYGHINTAPYFTIWQQ